MDKDGWSRTAVIGVVSAGTFILGRHPGWVSSAFAPKQQEKKAQLTDAQRVLSMVCGEWKVTAAPAAFTSETCLRIHEGSFRYSGRTGEVRVADPAGRKVELHGLDGATEVFALSDDLRTLEGVSGARGRWAFRRSWTVGIVGGTALGRGMAVVFARGGANVLLYDSDVSKAEKTVADMRRDLDELQREGILSGEGELKNQLASDVHSRVQVARTLEEVVEKASFIHECLVDAMHGKSAIFGKLDALLEQLDERGDEVIIGSSSSDHPASEWSRSLKHRTQMLVVHPSDPPHLIPLVEIVPSPWTHTHVVEMVRTLVAAMGQAPVVLRKEVPGFAADRLRHIVTGQAFHLVEDGVLTPDDIDTVMSAGLGRVWSFIGPFQAIDVCAKNGVQQYDQLHRKAMLQVMTSAGVSRGWRASTVDEVDGAMRREIPASRLPERIRWRDRQLVALTKHFTKAGELLMVQRLQNDAGFTLTITIKSCAALRRAARPVVEVTYGKEKRKTVPAKASSVAPEWSNASVTFNVVNKEEPVVLRVTEADGYVMSGRYLGSVEFLPHQQYEHFGDRTLPLVDEKTGQGNGTIRFEYKYDHIGANGQMDGDVVFGMQDTSRGAVGKRVGVPGSPSTPAMGSAARAKVFPVLDDESEVYVTVVQAADLPGVDNNTLQARVTVKYCDYREVETVHYQSSRDPNFQHEPFRFKIKPRGVGPHGTPAPDGRLLFQVWDYNKLVSHTFVGQARLDFADDNFCHKQEGEAWLPLDIRYEKDGRPNRYDIRIKEQWENLGKVRVKWSHNMKLAPVQEQAGSVTTADDSSSVAIMGERNELSIDVVAAAGLPGIDRGSIQPRVTVHYGDTEYAVNAKTGRNPSFKHRTFVFNVKPDVEDPLDPLTEPLANMRVLFKVWDWNQLSAHTFVGQCTVDFGKGFKKPDGETWLQIQPRLTPDGKPIPEDAKVLEEWGTLGKLHIKWQHTQRIVNKSDIQRKIGGAPAGATSRGLDMTSVRPRKKAAVVNPDGPSSVDISVISAVELPGIDRGTLQPLVTMWYHGREEQVLFHGSESRNPEFRSNTNTFDVQPAGRAAPGGGTLADGIMEFKMFDWNRFAAHTFVGEATLNFSEQTAAEGTVWLPLQPRRLPDGGVHPDDAKVLSDWGTLGKVQVRFSHNMAMVDLTV